MLAERMQRAARLDKSLYNEVERDEGATSQAATVVLIAAVASAIGSSIGHLSDPARGAVIGVVIYEILTLLIDWIVWSYVTYWVGTSIFGGTATSGELLRTLGFANAPRVLNIFGFVPILGGIIRLVVWIWVFIAGVVAIREALDFDTGRALATVIVGTIVVVVLHMMVWALLGLVGLTFSIF